MVLTTLTLDKHGCDKHGFDRQTLLDKLGFDKHGLDIKKIARSLGLTFNLVIKFCYQQAT